MRRISAALIISTMAPWLAYVIAGLFAGRELFHFATRPRPAARPTRQQHVEFLSELTAIERSLG